MCSKNKHNRVMKRLRGELETGGASEKMAEEWFDVVDEEDRVIGQAPRSRVHAERLLHRAVHIFVFNSGGEFLLHLRSATKDEYPLTYTSSASGHLAVDEEYDAAAARELQEELGLSGTLTRLHKLTASPETAYEHTVLYRIVTDRQPSPDPEEIAEVRFVAWEEVISLLRENPQKFSPPFRLLVEWYDRNRDNFPGE